jgi:hypothetical protein
MEALHEPTSQGDNGNSSTGSGVALRSVIREELFEGLRGLQTDLQERLCCALREELQKQQQVGIVDQKFNVSETMIPSCNGMRQAANASSNDAKLPGSVDDVGGDEAVTSQTISTGKCDSSGKHIARGESKVDEIGEQDPQASTKKKLVKKGTQSQMALFSGTEYEMTTLEWITRHRFYEICSGMLILLNAIYLGYQTQYLAAMYKDNSASNKPLGSLPDSFFAIQCIFCFLFFWELGLRWVADGFIAFFKNSDMWWNALDVLVVVTSCLEVLMEVIARATNTEVGGPQNVSAVRVLRVIRIVRVARIIRVMRFFRELRMMIFAILGSLKNLVWVIAVLLMTFYLFAVLFTTAVCDHLDTSDKWQSESNEELVELFGTLDTSVLSLFMAMSGGDDWSAFYTVLVDLPAQYRFAFLLFIIFSTFAVANIVTGVFVESALQANMKDRDTVVHEELRVKKDYMQTMREIFEEMDEDGKGTISMTEFEDKLKDERVIAYFNVLKLDVSDARTLFHLVDSDHSLEIQIEEFLEGCYKLQGESRALDMKIMQHEVHFLQEHFREFEAETRALLLNMHKLLNPTGKAGVELA